jgi:hypothetical protein
VVEEDCVGPTGLGPELRFRFVERASEVNLPCWEVDEPDDEVLALAAAATQVHIGELAGVGDAVLALRAAMQDGTVDLCDDAVAELVFTSHLLQETGELPTPFDRRVIAYRTTGMPSPGIPRSVAGNDAAAQILEEIVQSVRDAVCADEDQRECALLRLAEQRIAYAETLDAAMTDWNRFELRRAIVAHAADAEILGHETLATTFGTPCGNDPFSVAAVLLGRPVAQADRYTRFRTAHRVFATLLANDDPDEDDLAAAFRALLAIQRDQRGISSGARDR